MGESLVTIYAILSVGSWKQGPSTILNAEIAGEDSPGNTT